MAQIVVYGRADRLAIHRSSLSAAIHGALMATLAYPEDKKFHRFIGLSPDDFSYPADRGPDYTIIEISLFEGRSDEAKRRLITELFTRIEAVAGIAPHSVEIPLTETPKINWGIRGQNAEDLQLGYQVDV